MGVQMPAQAGGGRRRPLQRGREGSGLGEGRGSSALGGPVLADCALPHRGGQRGAPRCVWVGEPTSPHSHRSSRPETLCSLASVSLPMKWAERGCLAGVATGWLVRIGEPGGKLCLSLPLCQ